MNMVTILTLLTLRDELVAPFGMADYLGVGL